MGSIDDDTPSSGPPHRSWIVDRASFIHSHFARGHMARVHVQTVGLGITSQEDWSRAATAVPKHARSASSGAVVWVRGEIFHSHGRLDEVLRAGCLVVIVRIVAPVVPPVGCAKPTVTLDGEPPLGAQARRQGGGRRRGWRQ
eukprot:scaffold19892_cov124-Isochrysis_galbana.AAC.1